MTICRIILFTLISACLAAPVAAMASTPNFLQSERLNISEIINALVPDDMQIEPDNMQIEPDINLLPPPEKHVVGAVSYVSGGVSQDEAIQMKQMAKDYPLEVVCVQKTEEGDAYLASVILHITDAQGNVVLDVITDGPILLVDLPKGKYQIIAEYNNVIRMNRTNIGSKHQRVVFVWPR